MRILIRIRPLKKYGSGPQLFPFLPKFILSSSAGPVNLVAEDENRTVGQLLISQQRVQLNLYTSYYYTYYPLFPIRNPETQILGTRMENLQPICCNKR
jgi:hypothetical protein